MNAHESQQHGQRAFAAIHDGLERHRNSKLLVATSDQHETFVREFFDQISLQYQMVTLRRASGEQIRAFRVSMAACIFLATLNLMNSN